MPPSKDTLRLVNQTHQQLLFNLNFLRPAGRKTQLTPVELVPKGGVDVMNLCAVSKKRAYEIIEESPEVQQLLSKKKIFISDNEKAVKYVQAGSKIAVIAKTVEQSEEDALIDAAIAESNRLETTVEASTPVVEELPSHRTTDVPERSFEEIKQRRLFIQEEKRKAALAFSSSKDSRRRLLTGADGELVASAEGPTSSEAPKETLPSPSIENLMPLDILPSTKWEKARLLEYARSHGLEMKGDESKTLILKRIRSI